MTRVFRTQDKILVGGHWRPAGGGTYPIINPATEEIVGHAPEATVEDARAAARAAREAFERGPWPRMSREERGALLQRAADAFTREMESLVDLTVAETGALLRVARMQQVAQVSARLSRFARLALTSLDEEVPAPAGSTSRAVREPVGVVACITPFNFPMVNCAGKIGPALAMGNTVVVKPAPVDPLGVAELIRIVNDVGFPPGVINFVNGENPEVGAALVDSPDVDMVSFTGSTAVGQQIQAAAGKHMKRTLLELGGKSANLVFSDAALDKALAGAMSTWTFHSGQICTAPTRLLIERTLYEEFTRRMAEAARGLKIGDPYEEGVVVGPLVSRAQRARVENYIQVGRDEGATVACGGRRPTYLSRGFFIEPTLFTGARNDMRIAREEIFGPVVTAIPFRDEDEAIALANDSDYGLFGYVWSQDLERAQRVAGRMRTGTVAINGAPGHNAEAPFGGYKLSGIGRDGGLYALAAHTEIKHIAWTR
jgi:acyl-CoA reductase-like NAD-dependent aldehyde dehydrogenase